ncbi:MAG: ABC transporter substrate-binding protein [Nitrospirae bacterium]|nr:ABC transporter substrate-binding protein [Fimbriimonadaceae bacterium]
MPFFIATDLGYFEQAGVLVEGTALESSNQLVDAVVSGNLDIAVEVSAVPVLSVEAQQPGRIKIFAVSAITKEQPFDSLVVPSKSSIRTLKDLPGSRIGVFPGSTATALLRHFLDSRGVDTSAITFQPIPPQLQLQALANGSVDVLHAYEPTTAIALSRPGFVRLHGSVYAEQIEPNPQGVAIVSTRFLQEHPEAARKAIAALTSACAFMEVNDIEARGILERAMDLPRDVATSTVLLYMRPAKDTDSVKLQSYVDLLRQISELPKQVSARELLLQE